MKTSPQMVGLAAEFAEASELARRGIYSAADVAAFKEAWQKLE